MAKALGLSIALAAMLVALPASAASLINGSFEDTNDTAGLIGPGFTVQSALGLGDWNVYTTMPGWKSGPTKGFELQREPVVVTTPYGTNYIELESHPGDPSASSIIQDFTVAAGEAGLYLLSFYYQPRTPTPGDNLINALIDGNLLTTVSGPPDPAQFTWTLIEKTIHLAAGAHALEFNAFNTLYDNTLGGFIDNVSLDLVRKDDNPIVPLPAGLILLLSGLGGLGFLSRVRSKTA